MIRRQLHYPRLVTAQALKSLPDSQRITVVGLVTHRQRPATASGVLFMGLEDETGVINAVVWPKLLQLQRREVLQSQLLRIDGHLQNNEGVQHVIAESFIDESYRLRQLNYPSRDFR